jgi:hypothetical protein
MLYPNFREVLTRADGPSDKYHAVTFELNKRFSNGLTFTNNYTWAKNITVLRYFKWVDMTDQVCLR